MKQLIRYTILCVLVLWLAGCSVSVPQDAQPVSESVSILPDNDGATLPPNIAPLNFRVLEQGDECVVTLEAAGQTMVLGGPEVDIDVEQWHQLLEAARGDTLRTTIYIKMEGQWYRYPTLLNPIAREQADPYISYRIIHPGYVEYEDITIRQRNITNWEERILYDNADFGKEDATTGQCVNCHNYQNYNAAGRMQLHLREMMGGTLITDGKQVTKVNLKTDSTFTAGAYPAWHPTLPLIAYSANATGQAFHTSSTQKVEVIDYGSDLFLYDIPDNRVYSIEEPGTGGAPGKTGRTPDDYEAFPAWNPDGTMLYYCVAHHHQTMESIDQELNQQYDSLRYDIFCRPFDLQSKRFGAQQLVAQVSVQGKSASFPRISPDGRYLLYGVADYGQFHIWHHSADLAILDLQTGQTLDLSAANSEDADSYHSWSSNGRWILFSSRRIDGSYTRLYMAYFDSEGRVHKPLLLPQREPDYYSQLFRSYNVPEWMQQPVEASQHILKEAARGNAKQAQYAGNAVQY